MRITREPSDLGEFRRVEWRRDEVLGGQYGEICEVFWTVHLGHRLEKQWSKGTSAGVRSGVEKGKPPLSRTPRVRPGD
jgi:hypothetical protein